MPRDYAKSSKREKKPGQLPGWAWMLGGLAIGLFVAFLVYLSHQPHAHIAFKPSELLPTPKKQHDARDVRKDNVAKAPPGPSASSDHKPRFDFYTILPDMEVEVPEKDLDTPPAKPGQAPAKPALEPNANYILQVGAFRNRADAEALKAKLALTSGLQANVQSVNVGNDTWHRVRLGPYHNLEQLNAARAKLQKGNIPAIVLKLKS